MFTYELGSNNMKPFFDKLMNYENFYCGTNDEKKNILVLSLIKYLEDLKQENVIDKVKIITQNKEQISDGKTEEIVYRIYNGGVAIYYPENLLGCSGERLIYDKTAPKNKYNEIWDYPKTSIIKSPKIIIKYDFGKVIKVERDKSCWSYSDLLNECNLKHENIFKMNPFELGKELAKKGFETYIQWGEDISTLEKIEV